MHIKKRTTLRYLDRLKEHTSRNERIVVISPSSHPMRYLPVPDPSIPSRLPLILRIIPRPILFWFSFPLRRGEEEGWKGRGGWPGHIIKAAWKQYKTIKGSYHNRAVQPGTILYLAGKRGRVEGYGSHTREPTYSDRGRGREGGGGVSCLIYVIITWSPESKLGGLLQISDLHIWIVRPLSSFIAILPRSSLAKLYEFFSSLAGISLDFLRGDKW